MALPGDEAVGGRECGETARSSVRSFFVASVSVPLSGEPHALDSKK